MAEDGFVDYDDDNAFEWLYVEDDYPLADELAETQIPSPGYINAEHEIATFEFDPYDYLMDVEYGDNEYWDYGRGTATASSNTQKRKRGTAAKRSTTEKKRKLDETEYNTVLFVPLADRVRPRDRTPTDPKKLKSFALLPDWRTRYAGKDGEAVEKDMPAEMKIAAESKDDESPQTQRQVNAMVTAEDGEEEWEDGNAADAEEGEDLGDLQEQLASLDPEMLKAILKQRLGDAGLDGMDEGAFMQTIAKMLSGEGDGGDAASDLTTSLLDRANGGTDSALTGWLSQQGVSLDAAGDDEEGDDEDEASIVVAQPSAKGGKGRVEASPQDSAIGASKGSRRQMAMHGSSPSSARKRGAPEDGEVAGGSGKKRKRVVFDIAGGPETPNGVVDGDENITVACAPGDRSDSIAVAEPKPSKPAPVQDDDESITVANSKDTSTRATKSNKHTPNIEPTDEIITSAVPEDFDDEIQVVPKKPAAPAAKQGRKRKANSDVDEAAGEDVGARSKRQARKVTMPEASDDETAGRRSRSTRAKAGR